MQGFNMGRYVPPDQEGLVTSGNRVLGVRAQKANADGVPIVRFEMPFAVWCAGCEQRTVGRDGQRHPVLIGQGVRFNAEKHRTGSYYTTPIFTFRMRHPACGGWIAIRTDPATTSYVVEEGARKRDYGDDDDVDDDNVDDNDVPKQTADERQEARLDAFDRLERTIAHRAPDTSTPAETARRLGELADQSAKQWDAPYERNRALRAAFRAGRHAREQAAADDDGLRARLGGLDDSLRLLPATEADARMAALVDYGTTTARASNEASDQAAVRQTLARPLFGNRDRERPRALRLGHVYAATTETAQRQKAVREHLASSVLASARVAKDPFVMALEHATESPGSRTRPKAKRKLLPVRGVKRATSVKTVKTEEGVEAAVKKERSPPKRARHTDAVAIKDEPDAADVDLRALPSASTSAPSTGLVDYDSD